MRTTNHFGGNRGARVVELRRGSVHHVDIGSVERYSAEEQALGAGVLRFCPTATISGRAARELAASLSVISLAAARGEIAPTTRLDRYDVAINATTRPEG